MEFVTLITFMLMIFTVTLVVIQQKTYDINDVQKNNQLKSLSNVIKNEVDMAHAVHTGYKKYFWLPDYINGEEYTIELINSEIIVSHATGNFYVFLNTNSTLVYGNISKGDNTIIKNDSGIFILPGKI